MSARFKVREVAWREHEVLVRLKFRAFYEEHFKHLDFPPEPVPWQLPAGWWARWELWRRWCHWRGPKPGARSFIFTMADDPGGEWLGFGDIYAVPPVGHLGNVGVLPAARGKGVGSFVTEYRIALMANAGCTRVYAHVDPDNPSSSRIREMLKLVPQPQCWVIYRIFPAKDDSVRVTGSNARALRNWMAVLDQRHQLEIEWKGRRFKAGLTASPGIAIVELDLPSDLPPTAWPAVAEAARLALGLGPEVRWIHTWRGQRLSDQPRVETAAVRAFGKSEAWVWEPSTGHALSDEAWEAVGGRRN